MNKPKNHSLTINGKDVTTHYGQYGEEDGMTKQQRLKKVETEALGKLQKTIKSLSIDSGTFNRINLEVRKYCHAYAELECFLRV